MTGEIIALALLAAVNPKLFGVVLLIMENRRSRAMFLCFLAGGMAMSVGVGYLVLDRAAFDTQRTIGATVDLVLGVVLLLAAWLIHSGRLHGRRKPKERTDGWAERTLREPHLLLAVVVGAIAGTPGGVYITALKRIDEAYPSTGGQLIAILVFNLIMFTPVIVPMILLWVRPEATRARLHAFSAWLAAHAKVLIVWVLLVVGLYMTVFGLAQVLT